MTRTPNPSPTGIEQAVSKAGSQMHLAARLESRFPEKPHPSQQAVSQWVRQGYAPKDRAKEIAEITGVPFQRLLSPKLRELLN
jgi:hypothetical protein